MGIFSARTKSARLAMRVDPCRIVHTIVLVAILHYS